MSVNPTLQPVALLLLDINMPIMTGMEVMLRLKKKYKEMNEKAKNVEGSDSSNSHIIVLKPFICYYSQYDRATMMNFMTEEEKADYYLEKPLPLTELISLLKLINVI